MTEPEQENQQKEIIKPTRLSKSESRILQEKEHQRQALENWIPKTELGRLIKAGKEKDIDKLLKGSKKIMESQIIDTLLPLETDFISIGQSKGKFGGGKRRAWRQTQKKTQESNIPSFSAMVVVGDKKGHIGAGYGKAKETLPAKEKAIRQAKLNIIKITRGFKTNEPGSNDPHTVPFKVKGKCGSIRITLLPAPRGTGLVVGDETKKLLRLAGIRDVYSITKGKTKTTFNVIKACLDALEKTNEVLLK